MIIRVVYYWYGYSFMFHDYHHVVVCWWMEFTTIYHLFVYSGVEIRKRLRDSLIAWMGGRMAFDALVLFLFLPEQSSPIQSRIIYSIYHNNSDIMHVILSVMRNLVISVMAMGTGVLLTGHWRIKSQAMHPWAIQKTGVDWDMAYDMSMYVFRVGYRQFAHRFVWTYTARYWQVYNAFQM